MKALFFAIQSAAAVLFAALLVAAALNTSSWFIWNLSPRDPDIALLVDYTRVGAAFAALSGQYRLSSYLLFDANSATRFVYSRSEESDVIIAVPRFSRQRALPRQLANDGWHVRRLGLAVIAWQGKAPAPRLGEAFLETLKKRQLPWRPLLITQGKPGVLRFDHPSFQLLVWPEGQPALNLSLALNAAEFAPWPKETPSPSSQQLALNIPGHIVSQLPEDLHASWNEYLAARLSFSQTTPDIMSSLAAFPSLAAAASDTTAAVGVFENAADFIALTNRWVGREQAYTAPVTAAFLLPDGTLGYEQRPGEVEDAFQPYPDVTGCRALREADRSLSLCQKGDKAYLTTDPAFSPFAEIKPVWSLSFGPETAARLPIPGQRMTAWGAGGEVFATLQ